MRSAEGVPHRVRRGDPRAVTSATAARSSAAPTQESPGSGRPWREVQRHCAEMRPNRGPSHRELRRPSAPSRPGPGHPSRTGRHRRGRGRVGPAVGRDPLVLTVLSAQQPWPPAPNVRMATRVLRSTADRSRWKPGLRFRRGTRGRSTPGTSRRTAAGARLGLSIEDGAAEGGPLGTRTRHAAPRPTSRSATAGSSATGRSPRGVVGLVGSVTKPRARSTQVVSSSHCRSKRLRSTVRSTAADTWARYRETN